MIIAVSTALVALCIADGSLVGYRSVCGRSAFVDRTPLDRRGMRKGVLSGVEVVAAIGAWLAALLASADDGPALLDDLTAAGTRMCAVYASAALVALVGVAAISVSPPRWGSLAMVTVLGPLTLLRPVVLLTGAAASLAGAREHRIEIAASSLFVLIAVGVESLFVDHWGNRAASAFVPARQLD